VTDPACLVLRLAAPLQSWGSAGRHLRRDTESQPTKSGIVGLLAAAEGRRRADPIEDLAGLLLGVRTDQPGHLVRDYHTVSRLDGTRMPKAERTKAGKRQESSTGATKVTERFYLADAVFVVALEGSSDLLLRLVKALREPRYALSLGRRSCPPTMPLHLHFGNEPLWPGHIVDVLATVPWQAGPAERHRASERGEQTLVVQIHADDAGGDLISHDVPTTFHPKQRLMSSRRVSRHHVKLDTGIAVDRGDVPHDPFALLGD
jgi:CRISPR system Cascade subunit CasD